MVSSIWIFLSVFEKSVKYTVLFSRSSVKNESMLVVAEKFKSVPV